MSNRSEENFVLHAKVEGLDRFESDTAALESALEGLYQRIQQSVAANLGVQQIAELEEKVRGLRAMIAAGTRDEASQRATGLQTKYDKETDPDKKAKLLTQKNKAETDAEKAEAGLLTATKSFAVARRARVALEEKAVEQERKDALALEAQRHDAMLESARSVRHQADDAIRTSSAALRDSKDPAFDAELNGLIRKQRRDAEKEVADQKKAAEKAQADADRALQHGLSPSQIDDLTQRGRPGQNYDTSSTGRLSVRQTQQEIAVDQADLALLNAKKEALTGAMGEAEMGLKLRQLAEARYRAGQALQQTQELLRTAFKEEADAARNTAMSARQGPLAAARSNFMIGFKGASDVPYLQQAGQAAKFSVLYGSAYKALFAITQTFQASLQEGIDFQQGLSDMAVATGRSKKELGDLSERLASIAADAGGSPAAGLQIGARSVGLYGLAGTNDKAQQDYVAELSARVVTRASMGTKVDPVTLQQNIAAVTQAMGMGAGGQIRVTDLDQYFAKKFGSAPGDTLEAAAQSSSVGIAAGFSLEEIQALAALMIGRTGQSSNAVGGYMAQIFSRGGEGSLTAVAGKYGIETSGRELADVFRDLSTLYKSASPNQQSEISAAFGRGKVQNAVVAALQSWDKVASEAHKAEGGAADGSLDKAFSERISNIGGQINLLTGDLKEFAHLFGESGLLTVLGAGIKVLDLTVEGLNDVLSLYNELSPALRELIAAVLTGVVAFKFTSASSLVSGMRRGELPLGMARRAGLVAGEKEAIAKLPGTVLDEKGAIKAVQVGSSGIAAAGRAAVASIGPWALATAALVGFAELYASQKEAYATQTGNLQAIRQSPDADASAGDLRNYASQLRARATASDEANSLTKRLMFGIDLGKQADALRKEADRLTNAADEVAGGTQPNARIIGGMDAASIASGLDQISANGGETAQRILVLGAAIERLGHYADRTFSFIDTGTLAGKLAGSVTDLPKVRTQAAHAGGIRGWFQNTKIPGIGQSVAQIASNAGALARGDFGDLGDLQHLTGPMADYEPEVARQLNGTEIRKRLDRALAKRHVSSYDQLSDAEAKKVSAEVTRLDMTGPFEGRFDAFAEVQGTVAEKFYKALLKQRNKIEGSPELTGNLSNKQAKATMEGLTTEFGNRIDSRLDSDYKGKIETAQRWLSLAQQTRAHANNDQLPAIQKGLLKARTAVATATIDELEALRKVAEQKGKNEKQRNAISMPFVTKEINAAVKSRNADVLARVIAGAGSGAIAIARKAILDARAVAVAAVKAEKYFALTKSQLDSTKGAVDGLISSITSGDPQAKMPGTLGELLDPKQRPAGNGGTKKAKKLVGVYDQMLEALKTTPYDTSYDTPKDDTPKESAAQKNAARMAAWAAKKGGDIAGARAAIAQASADLHDAKKGSVAYYNALASMYEARQQLSDALAAYRKNVRSLHIDITDPVAQARLDLQEARRKLRRDAGKGRDVLAQDRVDIRQGAVSLESEKFNQRLSDVQTAEQLGRISHTAYMRYLQNEHDRLQAIGHRTRQQQDELNQIDQLMLDAKKEMSGAFNIGDIKLPTPYEVRKYVKEQAGLGASDKRVMQSTTQVYIDGADVGMVKRVISETVGKNAQVMTVTPRRI